MFPFRYGGSSSFYPVKPGSWDIVITPEMYALYGPILPNTSDTAVTVGSISIDPHTRAIARLVLPVGATQARTVVMLDAPGGGVRLEATGAP